LAALEPGVLGQTGIESSAHIQSVSHSLNLKCIVVIDALASRKLEILATTLQLSDTGIAPGSGVCNARSAINQANTDVKVISIGIPTVVDAYTLACDVCCMSDENNHISDDSEMRSFFVSPRDCDVVIEYASKLIGYAINLAVHLEMKYEDIPDLLT
ncbi:MAG TPA: GPR endopeptidase, partial [Bacillota bacterium]|nr:GPR endopeptidase [Bacillota bacterium]